MSKAIALTSASGGGGGSAPSNMTEAALELYEATPAAERGNSLEPPPPWSM